MIVTLLNQRIIRPSPLLQQLSTQTTEQLRLINDELANLDRCAEEKLAEVDVVLMSVETSLSSMEDSIMSATQALPTVAVIQGWVKDVVVSERLATYASMAPSIPPPSYALWDHDAFPLPSHDAGSCKNGKRHQS